MGRDMRLLWRDQPRVTLKVAVYLTDVESPDDGALEVVPRSHLDTASRYPTEEQPDGVPILGPAGTVAVFDARLWHRRRDNLGTRIRRAMFMAYSYRWLTSRDIPFEDVPEWAGLPLGSAVSCSGTRRSTRSTGPPASSRSIPARRASRRRHDGGAPHLRSRRGRPCSLRGGEQQVDPAVAVGVADADRVEAEFSPAVVDVIRAQRRVPVAPERSVDATGLGRAGGVVADGEVDPAVAVDVAGLAARAAAVARRRRATRG